VISLWVLGIALLIGCDREPPTEEGASRLETRALTIATERGQVRLRVEIADDDIERARGLMGRTSLEPGSGMAFLFEDPTAGGFWMKDMLIPLSIAFWDEEGRIVDLFDMEPCREEPCPSHYPRASYVGAVEVPQGFFDEQGVRIGDVVRLEP
jgi:hypothetical protein